MQDKSEVFKVSQLRPHKHPQFGKLVPLKIWRVGICRFDSVITLRRSLIVDTSRMLRVLKPLLLNLFYCSFVKWLPITYADCSIKVYQAQCILFPTGLPYIELDSCETFVIAAGDVPLLSLWQSLKDREECSPHEVRLQGRTFVTVPKPF